MSRSLLLAVGLLFGAVALLGWLYLRGGSTAPPASSVAANVVVTPTQPKARVARTEESPQLPSPPVDVRPFAGEQTDLRRQALAGDGHAAWRLGMAIANCNGYVPVSEESLENWVVDVFAGFATVKGGTPDSLLAKLKLGAAQKARDCDTAPAVNEDDPTNKAFEWIELGASLGDTDAQAMYGAFAFTAFDRRNALADAERIRERKRLALEYLERSLSQGNALALQQYSRAYADGRLFPQDKEFAYQYLYAYSLTSRANDYVPGLLELALESGAQGLDAAALVRAEEAGRLLANCCTAGKREPP